MSTGRAQKDKTRVHIRWMIRRDMSEVMTSEVASFEYAWTEDDFLRCLRQRNCIGMVAERDDRVVGFMIYELHKTRLHILNFAVHPSARRNGIGGQMVAKLINKLSTHRRQKITLAVRERNLAAQVFFRAFDFRATKVLRNYYSDSGEDAFQMSSGSGSIWTTNWKARSTASLSTKKTEPRLQSPPVAAGGLRSLARGKGDAR